MPPNPWCLHLDWARSAFTITEVIGREDPATSVTPEAYDKNPNLGMTLVQVYYLISDRNIRLK